MLGPMDSWIDIKSGEKPGKIPWAERVRLGGEGCEVLALNTAGDELHLWPDPPRLVLAGSSTTPLVNGRAVEECPLEKGDTIQWQGMVIVVHPATAGEEAAPLKGAYPSKGTSDAPKRPDRGSLNRPAGASAPVDPSLRKLDLHDLPVARRILAGIAAEMGVGHKPAVKRWQAAVLRGEWDADVCATEVLEGVDLEAKALCERSGRIQRDLLMTSFQRGIRGAGRKARGAARGGSAILLANLVALLVYSLLIATLLILVRARWEYSLDGMVDGLLEGLGSLFGGGS